MRARIDSLLQGAHAAAHRLTSSPQTSPLPQARGTAAVLLTLLLVLCFASGALAQPVVFDKPLGADPAVGTQRCTYYPDLTVRETQTDSPGTGPTYPAAWRRRKQTREVWSGRSHAEYERTGLRRPERRLPVLRANGRQRRRAISSLVGERR